jgi:hypothetical protein
VGVLLVSEKLRRQGAGRRCGEWGRCAGGRGAMLETFIPEGAKAPSSVMMVYCRCTLCHWLTRRPALYLTIAEALIWSIILRHVDPCSEKCAGPRTGSSLDYIAPVRHLLRSVQVLEEASRPLYIHHAFGSPHTPQTWHWLYGCTEPTCALPGG